MPSAEPLEGKHIAILAEDLYEDLELRVRQNWNTDR